MKKTFLQLSANVAFAHTDAGFFAVLPGTVFSYTNTPFLVRR